MVNGLTVVVPVQPESLAGLAPLLDSLWQQTAPADEVLVIADGIQLPPAVAVFLPGSRVISTEIPFGRPACWNIGVQQARNEWVCLVAPGIALDAQAFEEAAITTGHDYADGNWRRTLYQFVTLGEPIEVTNAAMVTRSFWHTVGGFPVSAVCHDRPFDLLQPRRRIGVAMGRPLARYA